MDIRRAQEKDMDRINELLRQVCMVHHTGRPDLFKGDNNRKYTDSQLREIIHDSRRPIFVAVDESEKVLGYAFCIFQQHLDDNILTAGSILEKNYTKECWNLQKSRAVTM